MNNESIKMVVPCECPHCGAPIILDINQPYPAIDVLTPDEASDDIKNVINESDDLAPTTEAA